MSYFDIAREDLKRDEGERLKLYIDSVGKSSIGVGRNLTDKGIRPDEMALMLDNDMKEADSDARYLFPNFESLSDKRKAALVNMAFNLGQTKLAKFAKFRAAVAEQDWTTAAMEMSMSRWADQVGDRARRLAAYIREG